jgi:hypothetical protein
MMDTRDRMEEVGEILMLIKAFLFQTVIIIDYIYIPEELWACTLVMHV